MPRDGRRKARRRSRSWTITRNGCSAWPMAHAGIHLVRHPVVLHHLRTVVETAGLALHDEEPERISGPLDETIADFSIGSGRPRACGKCRQRGLEPPSKPSER